MTTDKSKNFFRVSAEDFKKIPGNPIAYWVSQATKKLFQSRQIANSFDIKAGICTGDNAKFILYWFEIAFLLLKKEGLQTKYAYTPHNKGGEFRKWYGNHECVLKYSLQALSEMEKNIGFRHDGKEFYFTEHIGWSKITSSKTSFRYYSDNFTFDSAGLGLFALSPADSLKVVLSFLNSG